MSRVSPWETRIFLQARCTPHSTFFGLEVARLLLLACVLRALGPLLTRTHDLEFTIFIALLLLHFFHARVATSMVHYGAAPKTNANSKHDADNRQTAALRMTYTLTRLLS